MPPDPMMDGPMMDEDMGLGGEEADEPVDEFERFASKAWPDMAGDTERLMAAKEAIRVCVERDLEGGYDEPAPKGKPDGIALILGAPKKKGK